MNLQAAIDAPLFHTGHYINSFAPRDFTPMELHIEDRFPEPVRRELAERGGEQNGKGRAGHDVNLCRAAEGREAEYSGSGCSVRL